MIVDCAVYQHGKRLEGHADLEAAAAARDEPDTFVWVGLHEPTSEEFSAVQREFDLHELAVEDAVKAHQRPKVERFDDSLLMVLKTARYVDPVEVVEFGEILIFTGDRFVVVVRHGDAGRLGDLRARLERDPEALRRGPGAVVHGIADLVVDDYAAVLQGLDADVQEVEGQVFSEDVGTAVFQRIYKLKREVLEFHRATWPLLDAVEQLSQGRHPEVVGSEVYLRDVHDHLLRVNEQVDAFREQLTGVLHAGLALLGVRQNEDMRRISALVGVAAVPTVIGAIYGMNFEHMPELDWTYGYPMAMALIAVCCLAAYAYFHRRGWL